MSHEPPFDVELRVGEIQDAELFDEARKPEMVKLTPFRETVFEHRSMRTM
jgi:hypothetical protein